MAETPEELRALDEPRALPQRLRARLEAALLAPHDPSPPGDAPLDGVDAPRAVPPPVRSRVERALVAASAIDVLRDAANVERDLPVRVRARIEMALLPAARAQRTWVVRALAVAASLILIAASVVAVVRAPDDGARDLATPGANNTTGGTSGGVSAGSDSVQADRGAAGSVRPFGDSITTGAAMVAGSGRVDGDQPPPFTESAGTYAAMPAPASGPAATSKRSASPLVVGIARGDPQITAGFDAYVRMTNARGGIHGRSLVAVDAPKSGAITTVNLGSDALGTTTGPVLESIAVPERILLGNVFDVASAAERQARVLAGALFPARAENATAAIYVEPRGIFADTVPMAIEEALRARGVTTVRVTFDGSAPPVLVPADATFLSMSMKPAMAWVREARARSYAPARGIGAMYPLLDRALVGGLPDRLTVASPYALVDGSELATLEQVAQRPANAALIHGWTTAKALAYALWESEADSRAEAQVALENMDGFPLWFAPPYSERRGTHARTPDAIVYEVRRGAFIQRGDWRTDQT